MSVLYSFMIICLFGRFEARHPDIDINRVKLVPKEESRFHQPNTHGRRSVNENYYFSKENDFDDRRSRLLYSKPAAVLLLPHTPTPKEQKALKFHQPREDPQLFYQSDEYLKKMAPKDLNNEVSYIYPGREVIRQQDKSRLSIEPSLDDSLMYNVINSDTSNLCVRCPHDRTLIAKAGSDRVVLQYPRLQSCAHGRRLPKNVRFVHMYGPNFGSLLEQGSHIIVGKIVHNHKSLQICKMQISIVAQTCAVPKSLFSHCDANNKNCTFVCRDPKHTLHGQHSLTCEDGKRWSSALPVCKARTWCELLLPPDHGHISCKGATTDEGTGLLEGSSCRVRCQRGWKLASRASAVCRRGAWTHKLACQPKKT